MSLSQEEADNLLGMPKQFVEDDPLEFTETMPMNYERLLLSADRREQFILTVERGNRKRIRLKFQTRARKVIVLARLDLNGPDHRNPPESPYRPNERLSCPHIHVFREGFDDRIAFMLSDVHGLAIEDANDGVRCLEDFLNFCRVEKLPKIQLMI